MRHPPLRISIRFENMVAGVLDGGGIDPARFLGAGAAAATGAAGREGDLVRRFREAFEVVRSRRTRGELGFLDLPEDRSLLAQTLGLARTLEGRFDNIVVVGIGGSALGAAALRNALVHPGGEERGAEGYGHRPRLYVMDNPDPDSTAALLGRIDLARTLFNVVSKSGSTVETLAHFLVIRQRLEERLGRDGVQDRRSAARTGGHAEVAAVRDHVVVTTDPERGFLRSLAREYGLRSLSVPRNVGGRFSVLSPVGLFPAALAGIDPEAVLEGAAAMAERCDTPELTRNPAGILATLLHLADTEMGASIQVFMPYADRLRGLAYWLQQLWAESLGKAVKTDGTATESGPTPLPAFGAADQHSLLQLFMEGPRDKVVVLLARGSPGEDVLIPPLFADSPAVSHLGGRTLFELLDYERVATAEALRRAGRANMTVTVDRVDARSIGGLFMLFQIAVVHAGALYGVDPLDQPGVELAKSLAVGLMGRPGRVRPTLHPPDPRWRV